MTSDTTTPEALTSNAEEKPSILPAFLREEIIRKWDAATTQESREALMNEVARRLAVAPNDPQALFTAAVGHGRNGEHEPAARALLRLSRLLETDENWEDLREIARQGLEQASDYRLVRRLLSADEHLGDDEQTQADIAYARRRCPNSPDILWLDSQRADAEGRDADAASLAASAMARYVVLKDAERAEEPVLRVLESSSRDRLRELLKTLPTMIAHEMDALVTTTLDLGLPELRKAGLLDELVDTFEQVLLHGKPPAWLRGTYVDLLAESLGGRGLLSDIIAESKIADDSMPFEKALTRFRDLAVFRPGAYVTHNTWGIGEIQANDGSALVVNFADRESHRMDLEIARRALRPLSPDLIRVLAFRDPEGLAREVADDPVALVVRAINEFGVELTARELKPMLVGMAVPEAQWTNWWRETRAKLTIDPRIDPSKVHQGVYGLAKEGQEAAAVELPPLDPKKGIKGAVAAVGRMLKQNPHIAVQLRDHYGPTLQEWVSEAHNADDRLRGALYLSRWYPDRSDEWQKLVADAFAGHAAGILAVTGVEDQAELLEIGLAGAAWREAALSGLASRFNAVRQRAIEVLQERLGDGLKSALEKAMAGALRRPAEVLAIADLDLQGALPLPEGEALDPWDILHATLLVLIAAESKTVHNEALEVLDPLSELARRLRDTVPSEAALARLKALSERYELPGSAADAGIRLLMDTGHEELIGAVLGDRFVDRGEDVIGLHFTPRATLMTQATYDRSKAEVETMRLELATKIPQEIAAARALGDLAENAEYHAARERQGIMTAMEKTLNGELQQARIIDGLKMPDGVVGVATEVELRNVETDESQTLWILGHRDNEMYDAINYRAALGQALCGKKVGEIVEVDLEGGRARLEVISVRHRSPVGEPVKLPPPEPA